MEPIKKSLNEFLTEHFAYVKTSRLDRVRSQDWDCCQLGYASIEVKCYFEDAFAKGSDDDRKELFGNIRLILRRLCRDYSKLNRLPVDVSVAPVMATGYEDDVNQFLGQITKDLEPIQELYEYLRKTYAVVNALPLLPPPQLKTNLTDAERERLFDELVKGCFMAANTDKTSFLWAFGGSMPPAEFKQLKWLKTDASLVYLIYALCNDPLGVNNHWVAGQEIFGVMNMAKKRDRYYNNKNGKPNGSEVIDGILSRTKGGQ